MSAFCQLLDGKKLRGVQVIDFMAAPQGFEPRYADPESAVLPLNEGAVSGEREALTAFRFYGRFLSSVNDREPTKVGVRSRSDTLEFL